MFISRHRSKRRRKARTPARCPKTEGRRRSLAQRLLPSIMTAMCRGKDLLSSTRPPAALFPGLFLRVIALISQQKVQGSLVFAYPDHSQGALSVRAAGRPGHSQAHRASLGAELREKVLKYTSEQFRARPYTSISSFSLALVALSILSLNLSVIFCTSSSMRF